MDSSQETSPAPTASKPGVEVILADRDIRFSGLAKAFLEAAGHRVTLVDDGAKALEAVRSQRPRVLIAEILLPKLDGLALCRAVKADEELKATRVLVFSILSASARAKEAGADGFLGKPLVQSRLAAALRILLEQNI